MTRTVMSEIFKDMIRDGSAVAPSGSGAMRGTGVVTVRFGERPAETALQTAIEALMRDKAVACGEIWRAADALEFPCAAPPWLMWWQVPNRTGTWRPTAWLGM